MKPPAQASAPQSPLGGCLSLKDEGKCYPHLLVYKSGPEGCRTKPPGDPKGDQQCACHTRPKRRGSSPSSRGREVMGASPGRQEGQHGPLRSGPSQNALQPCRPDFRPPTTSGPWREPCLLLRRRCPSRTARFVLQALAQVFLFQEASLMPQPDLSASSGPLPGPCLCHYGPDHPVL